MLNIVNVPESHEVIGTDEKTGMCKVSIPVIHKQLHVGDYVDFVPSTIQECEVYKTIAIGRLGEVEFWNAAISGCRVKYAAKVRKPEDAAKDEKDLRVLLGKMSKEKIQELLDE